MATIRHSVRLPRQGEPTPQLVSFRGLSDGKEHVALLYPDRSPKTPLVRVHSECLTGDVLGSRRCDCGEQLAEALKRISREGGVLLYLRQEGRGIGLYEKLAAYSLQENGLDTFEANAQLGRGYDERSYDVAAEMLAALRVSECRLLTNNPAKVEGLRDCGIQVTEVVPTSVFRSPENSAYLDAKERITGHRFADSMRVLHDHR